MITPQTKSLPKIIWERQDQQEMHDNFYFEYSCVGESEDGRLWAGRWWEMYDDFVEIDNIEEL